jgi:L-methionine (R)-S-oxide reductase
MAEALNIPLNSSKEELYQALIPQVASVIDGTDDMIANLANISAILKQAFDFHWVGFYRKQTPEMLVLGPFQGPLACVTIPFSKGVCGAAARKKETIIVRDVNAFPGHIACSSLTKSEIVVPLVHAGATQLVLDIDSDKEADFDDIDRRYLEQVVGMIKIRHFAPETV